MRNMIFAACASIAAFGGLALAPSAANAQVTLQFGTPGYVERPYYPVRPDYRRERPYGWDRGRGHGYGRYGYRDRPRCRIETRWEQGRHGPRRRTYEICR